MNRILLITLTFALCFGCSLEAQETISKKDVKNEIKNLSDKKAKDVLTYARTIYKPNAKKELENIVKELDDNQISLLHDFISVVNKYAEKKEAEDKKKQQPTPPSSAKFAKFNFETTTFDFGTIEDGAIVTHNYKFTNTGSIDLNILNIQSTCGCAVPEWPKEKIKPGDSAEIKVTFNSTGKLGVQSKRIIIYANTEPQSTFLFVAGEVTKKPE